jgi:O-antigen/teichoic acid export membrane protein
LPADRITDDRAMVHRVVGGTAWSFLAEALIVPTGLLTAAFLTRRLGPEAYGVYVIAATLIGWIEWTVTTVFSRTTVKFVGEAEDWSPVGETVVRQYLLVSVPVALLVWLLAGSIGQALEAPVLGAYLRLFALEIPLFSLARAHREILTGLHGFTEQALTGAVHWIARLALIVILVEAGLSVTGAILGSVGATAVELAVSRAFVRPRLSLRSSFPARRLWAYAAPLFLAAMSQRLFNRVDLVALKGLGGTAAQAGVYGAAQNISLFPGLFAMSMTPVLLAAVGRQLRAGDEEGARALGRGALRAVLLLLPFAALIAGCAGEIAKLVFGPAFTSAGPLMALLVLAALGMLVVSVASTLLIAADRPRRTLALSAPLLPLALFGHVMLIPRLGPTGAAAATTTVAGMAALAALVMLDRTCGIRPPAATLWRSLVVAGPAYLLAAAWPTAGLALFLKLIVIGALAGGALAVLGELRARELSLARSLLGGALSGRKKRELTS